MTPLNITNQSKWTCFWWVGSVQIKPTQHKHTQSDHDSL